MPRQPIDPDKLRNFFLYLSQGADFMSACMRSGMNPTTAQKYADALNGIGEQWRIKMVKDAIAVFPSQDKWGPQEETPFPEVGDATILDPKAKSQLSTEALNALNNVEYFAERYFGFKLAPWQKMAADEIIKLLSTGEKEYACINVAPGSGKTAFFTLVIPAWLICRDRSIRGMTGHVGANIAKQEVDNLRRTLERDVPMRATDSDLKWGTGKDAIATLAEDYGRFKPLPSENAPWRAEYFTVAQLGGIPTAEKERTWSAFGYTSSYIGTRVNFAVWDDADDADKVSDLTRDQIKRKWDDVAEKRIEPGGLLVLQGQRLGGDDLYRHVLDKRRLPDDIDDLDDESASEWPQMYKHIVFKAHYQDKCKGKETHRRTSKPWPDGCLLVPTRISWNDIQKERLNNPKGFETLYQQEDVSRKHTLAQQVWIDGGVDPDTKEEYPGCWDAERGPCEYPRGLSGTFLSIATADPSPSNQWAIQWWVVHPDSGQRFLMDLIGSPLTAPDVLDWNVALNDWTGILQDWQARSKFLGIPITHWIIEANAAQKFILQYEHVKRWKMKWGVDIIPHQTTINKSDKDYGVWSLAPHYRYGRVRLPGSPQGRSMCQKLVNEITRYPDARYDDQVMASWFMEWNLPRISITSIEFTPQARPSWSGNFTGRFFARK